MPGNNEQSAKRTEFAEDRTVLANERTFAGWMRTSLACIALGVGFHALFNKVDPAWLPRAVSSAFLLLGVLVIILAERRAASVVHRLDPHTVKAARPLNLRIFVGIVVVGAGVLGIAIWTMEAS